MAFGHSDTDAFYDRLVSPVLRRNGVTPIVINRTLSNDDLNSQIIKQLTQADFSICDLTYARPSVYFEAGFAQRAGPVFYTVRKDHLQLGQPDDRRVHFDLQMKPLITWENATDVEFADRLERRLRASVLRTLGQDRAALEAVQNARNEFARLPLAQRVVIMRRVTIQALRAAAFDAWRNLSTTLRQLRPIN
jgi:nucleoside 2-deoxyribosyltransferase